MRREHHVVHLSQRVPILHEDGIRLMLHEHSSGIAEKVRHGLTVVCAEGTFQLRREWRLVLQRQRPLRTSTLGRAGRLANQSDDPTSHRAISVIRMGCDRNEPECASRDTTIAGVFGASLVLEGRSYWRLETGDWRPAFSPQYPQSSVRSRFFGTRRSL